MEKKVVAALVQVEAPRGNPDLLRVRKANWSGRGLVLPPSLLLEVLRDREAWAELEYPGVYVLRGRDGEVRVGAGDTVLDALSELEALPSWVHKVGVFVDPDRGLNLPSALHVAARLAGALGAEDPPKPPYALPEAHKAYAEEFLRNLEMCLRGLGWLPLNGS